MSRRIESAGFVVLLKARSRLLNERVEVGDIVCLANTSGKSLRRYLSGSRPHRLLEQRLAEIFNLSIPQLRKRLGLPKTPPTTRRKHSDQRGNSRAV